MAGQGCNTLLGKSSNGLFSLKFSPGACRKKKRDADVDEKREADKDIKERSGYG